MSDDLKVGRIVFSGDTIYAGEGKLSPNPLEYAPKGTLQELATQAELLREAVEVVRRATDLRHGNAVEDVLILHELATALLPKLEAVNSPPKPNCSGRRQRW
jgi:hypothetical protein